MSTLLEYLMPCPQSLHNVTFLFTVVSTVFYMEHVSNYTSKIVNYSITISLQLLCNRPSCQQYSRLVRVESIYIFRHWAMFNNPQDMRG